MLKIIVRAHNNKIPNIFSKESIKELNEASRHRSQILYFDPFPAKD